MTTLPIDWVDAFTDAPFGGNGCAVLHGGAALDDETCKAVVRETSLVECTFTGPSEVADVRVRYFLAGGEIPFAGHPTIATVAAVLRRGLISGDTVTLETGAGLIPIEIDRSVTPPRIVMTQNAPSFGPIPDKALVADAVSLAPADILGQPQLVSTGLPCCVTVLKDRAALERAVLDPEALSRLHAAMGRGDAEFAEPFLVTLEGATAAGDTYARLLLPPPNPPEDPFTGSATGAMAAYLWSKGLIEGPSFTAEQGHGMGRPGQAQVEVLGPPEAITGVRVAGQAHVLISGDIHL
ncbi:PhzF family phenazine biosynthesis protein [Alloyangia pacifica]|uniref:Phenazine biosynthesis protein PhzF family n=1 Tax=Alloyangia pacifica TaxID=311180 RepID=A0A1I6S914_9RHOB|nr:PhzF family phenazine biosynthesis protein [Alloyangia pacifica]SDG73462.1 phenazine biosynthesis protein PhzF family [Alloyangia pacifica]SFS73427.1 phenazine biosynthesis protein PhzF family [Alloyangia pacifica]